jgi:hypothetical protein
MDLCKNEQIYTFASSNKDNKSVAKHQLKIKSKAPPSDTSKDTIPLLHVIVLGIEYR